MEKRRDVMSDMRFTKSGFGGGWLEPLTDTGEQWGTNWFADRPFPNLALPSDAAWVVEPYQVADLAKAMEEDGLDVERA